MKTGIKGKILSIVLAGIMIFSAVPALAVSSVNENENLVQNEGFENTDNATANWQFSGSAWIIYYSSYQGKSFHADAGANNSVSQAITVATAGDYTASAWLATGGTGCKFEVRDAVTDTVLKEVTVPSNSAYTYYELEPVVLQAGQQIKIVCRGGNGWIRGDAFGFYKQEVVTGNLLTNGSFETGTASPAGWSTTQWMPDGRTSFSYVNGGVEGSKCISVSTPTQENDAHWVQSVQLQPFTLYTLTGYIKGENIAGSGYTGAFVNVVGEGLGGVYESTFENNYKQDKPHTKGTFDWKPFTIKFLTPYTGVVDIECRLGYYSSTVTGTAYYDGLVLIPEQNTTLVKTEGQNVQAYFESSDMANITSANMAQWIERMDDAYNCYVALTGYAPYEGNKITVLSDSTDMPFVAYAGSIIQYNQNNIGNVLRQINDNDDWSFGILHEMGHNFDSDNWNFDAELMANFKMFYVVETCNAKVTPGSTQYNTAQLKAYYKSVYDARFPVQQDGYNNDALTYCLIRVKDSIGWAPFKATFRQFVSGNINPPTPLAKFDKFLELLQANYNADGTQVYDTFPEGELAYIRSLF